MRLFVIPISFGLTGAILFWLAISSDSFPASLSFLTFPGSMLSFALIHGSEGALGEVALIAGAVVQFIVFAIAGMFAAAASFLIG